jgi:DNA ligase-1
VIDCEAVAWDKEDKRLLPFQELSRRKRKDVRAEDIKVKVHLFAFDLLYLNGRVSCPNRPLEVPHWPRRELIAKWPVTCLALVSQPLLNENLEERRRLLRQHLQPVEEEFAFATSDDATSVEEIQVFLDKSVKEGCEGLMVKMLEGEGSTYEPSRRSIHWLKASRARPLRDFALLTVLFPVYALSIAPLDT